MCYVVRYRRKVIMTNLRNSFSEKSEKELKKICRGTYRNLTEQIINMLSQSGISEEEMHRRMVLRENSICTDMQVYSICKAMCSVTAML